MPPTLVPVASNTQKKGKVTKDLVCMEVFGTERANSTWRRIWASWSEASDELEADRSTVSGLARVCSRNSQLTWC